VPFAQEIKTLSDEEAPGRGGKVGGKIAASSSASAASVAKVLSGIEFPKNKDELIHYAEQNKDRVSEPDAVIETLKELRDTHFENMADVEKALGNIR
jgi:formiminotetrahydrofolate cyclodeaminase